MKAEISGNNFTFYLNGNKQGTVQDEDKKYDADMVGVLAWKTKARFDTNYHLQFIEAGLTIYVVLLNKISSLSCTIG